MTMPRYSQVSIDDTPWYHCVSRCVRRAFLCGQDSASGQNYEHRRNWVVQRIKDLATVFTIDIAAYAVMNNHYHIVVRIDNERAEMLSTEEVMLRWTRLHKGPFLISRYLSDKRIEMSDGELFRVEELADLYRARLCNLSWFMKSLNEYISRNANAEDKVKGHFWESRYKCQALLDDKALLAAMAYVDLNPVRAGMSDVPENSEFTSICERIREVKQSCSIGGKVGYSSEMHESSCVCADAFVVDGESSCEKVPLMPFDATSRKGWAVPFNLQDYIELVDWSGRAFHPDKRGLIPPHEPPILKRLGFNPSMFIQCAGDFLHVFGQAVGEPAAMTALCARRQVNFLRGMHAAKTMLAA